MTYRKRRLYSIATREDVVFDVVDASPVFHGVNLLWSVDIAARYASDVAEAVLPIYASVLDPMPLNIAIMYARGWSANSYAWMVAESASTAALRRNLGTAMVSVARCASLAAMVRNASTLRCASLLVRAVRREAIVAVDVCGGSWREMCAWLDARHRAYLFGMDDGVGTRSSPSVLCSQRDADGGSHSGGCNGRHESKDHRDVSGCGSGTRKARRVRTCEAS